MSDAIFDREMLIPRPWISNSRLEPLISSRMALTTDCDINMSVLKESVLKELLKESDLLNSYEHFITLEIQTKN